MTGGSRSSITTPPTLRFSPSPSTSVSPPCPRSRGEAGRRSEGGREGSVFGQLFSRASHSKRFRSGQVRWSLCRLRVTLTPYPDSRPPVPVRAGEPPSGQSQKEDGRTSCQRLVSRPFVTTVKCNRIRYSFSSVECIVAPNPFPQRSKYISLGVLVATSGPKKRTKTSRNGSTTGSREVPRFFRRGPSEHLSPSS